MRLRRVWQSAGDVSGDVSDCFAVLLQDVSMRTRDMCGSSWRVLQSADMLSATRSKTQVQRFFFVCTTTGTRPFKLRCSASNCSTHTKMRATPVTYQLWSTSLCLPRPAFVHFIFNPRHRAMHAFMQRRSRSFSSPSSHRTRA